jgi:ABC-type antimicrobial peptide transport system permease subunit
VAASALIGPLLFGITPGDPATHAAAVLLLVLAGLVAACWPAWRAARVNALEVLRWD